MFAKNVQFKTISIKYILHWRTISNSVWQKSDKKDERFGKVWEVKNNMQIFCCTLFSTEKGNRVGERSLPHFPSLFPLFLPPAPSLSFYKAFQRFGIAKFAYGGSILG